LRPKTGVTKLNRDQRKAKNLETPVGFSLSRWENLESVLKQEPLASITIPLSRIRSITSAKLEEELVFSTAMVIDLFVVFIEIVQC